jgi:glycosyltransferase involved in cell wall biosynthesis
MAMPDAKVSPLLVADAVIPTTNIVERILEDAYQQPVDFRLTRDIRRRSQLAYRTIVLSRVGDPQRGGILHFLRFPASLRYAYFIDDNFWEIRHSGVPQPLIDYHENPALVQSIEAYIVSAAVVIVPSENLREYLAARFPSASITYIPAAFDHSLLAGLPNFAARPTQALRIGYAGSTRISEETFLVPAIEHLLTKYAGRVEFEFIRWHPEKLAGRPGVSCFPVIDDYRHYLEFQHARAWDIGLAPLGANAFAAAKTNNKYREYGALGIPGVYSRVTPYADCVRDGETGLLAENSVEAWVAALERLIASPEARLQLSAAARSDVRARHDQRIVAAQWHAVLENIANNPRQLAAAALSMP